mgnify:CR=1 FL=1
MFPIIFLGQGGNRTRLVIDIIKSMNMPQTEYYLLKSSPDSNDSLGLREVKIHEFPNVISIIKSHNNFNYRIKNNVIDQKNLELVKKFKENLEDEIKEVNPKAIYFKEPRIRYLLPYFKKIFPSMKIVYIDRVNRTSIKHYESRAKLFNAYFNNQKKTLTEKDKVKLSNHIKKDNIQFFKQNKINYCIINTDNLIKRDSYKFEINKLKLFMDIDKKEEEYIEEINKIIRFKD